VVPKQRGMRLAARRPGKFALAARRAILAVLVCVSMTQPAANARAFSDGEGVPRIYHKGRNFRIPFNLNAEGRDRIRELHLLVSEDLGFHWRPISKTFPDHPTFTFRSSHDGEYWFAVQTRTTDGRVSPAPDSTVEPNLKVVVDSFPPSLFLEPGERRGSLASVRWEAKDENLDLKSLVLEYQVEGVGVWRKVPIARPKATGGQRWDAGTAEALKVRASVADKAGNVTEAAIELADATAGGAPDLASLDPPAEGPPSIAQISNPVDPEISAGPGFTPVGPASARSNSSASRTGRSTRPIRPRSNEIAAHEPRPPEKNWDRDPEAKRGNPPADSDAPPPDLFAAADATAANGNTGARPPDHGSSTDPPAARAADAVREPGSTLLVSSPKFKLQYAVDDAGPGGPASVELWITRDGGRTWIRRGDDPDKVSPIEVDLGGEGTFGICLVARSASGLGDQPPAPGDPPQSWVEVDGTPPQVQLLPPQVGTGVNAGKVAIAWRASDLHLPPKSVALSWRPDQPGAGWQVIGEGLENSGQFVWSVPASVLQKFHLKVEAVDTVGHRGGSETTDTGAITVDRSRPRSRIIGLDSSARSGVGQAGSSLR
jgi:hypothetical protein